MNGGVRNTRVSPEGQGNGLRCHISPWPGQPAERSDEAAKCAPFWVQLGFPPWLYRHQKKAKHQVCPKTSSKNNEPAANSLTPTQPEGLTAGRRHYSTKGSLFCLRSLGRPYFTYKQDIIFILKSPTTSKNVTSLWLTKKKRCF